MAVGRLDDGPRLRAVRALLRRADRRDRHVRGLVGIRRHDHLAQLRHEVGRPSSARASIAAARTPASASADRRSTIAPLADTSAAVFSPSSTFSRTRTSGSSERRWRRGRRVRRRQVRQGLGGGGAQERVRRRHGAVDKIVRTRAKAGHEGLQGDLLAPLAAGRRRRPEAAELLPIVDLPPEQGKGRDRHVGVRVAGEREQPRREIVRQRRLRVLLEHGRERQERADPNGGPGFDTAAASGATDSAFPRMPSARAHSAAVCGSGSTAPAVSIASEDSRGGAQGRRARRSARGRPRPHPGRRGARGFLVGEAPETAKDGRAPIRRRRVADGADESVASPRAPRAPPAPRPRGTRRRHPNRRGAGRARPTAADSPRMPVANAACSRTAGERSPSGNAGARRRARRRYVRWRGRTGRVPRRRTTSPRRRAWRSRTPGGPRPRRAPVRPRSARRSGAEPAPRATEPRRRERESAQPKGSGLRLRAATRTPPPRIRTRLARPRNARPTLPDSPSVTRADYRKLTRPTRSRSPRMCGSPALKILSRALSVGYGTRSKCTTPSSAS